MLAFRSSRRRKRQSGHAIVEVAFLCPWILFLFAGTFDVGFCAYSLIATQSAARVAAQYASQGPTTAVDQNGVCTWALAELNTLPGAHGLNSCSANPVIVTTSKVTGVDGAQAASVSVTYQTIPLIQIPGFPSRFNITRTAQMRLQTTS
ncbi:MAG: TadE family protein [Bryobacteraceae bacterium]